jgi:hypothetical protein
MEYSQPQCSWRYLHTMGQMLRLLAEYHLLCSQLMDSSADSSNWRHDIWSATEFSTPFLSRISTSNSWSRSIHRIRCGVASFFIKRYQSSMICIDNNLGGHQIRSKIFDGKYHGKFLFRCGVVQLGPSQSLACIGYSIMLLILWLAEHYSSSIITGITHDLKW